MARMLGGKMQRTIQKEITFSGVGLHSGASIEVTLRPAQANVGIQFIRSDVDRNHLIAARPSSVLDTRLATRLGTSADSSISTTEHLLAALYGFGIDNIIIEVNGPELPILDGSAAPFLALLDEAGVLEIKGSSRKLALIRSVIECVDENDPTRFIRIEPSKKPKIHYAIDFGDSNPIGSQKASFELNGMNFCQNFSFARTFCFSDEVEAMQKMGLARGGSLENAIVVSRNPDQAGVLNAHGLRHDDEFVQHKILDCIGDLMLVGMPVLGSVVANKAGHDLHTRLAGEIVAALNSSAVEVVDTAAQKPSLVKLLSFPKSLDEVSFGTPQFVVG